MKSVIRSLALLFGGLCAAGPVMASSVISLDHKNPHIPSSQIHTLAIQCPYEGKTVMASRLAVLETSKTWKSGTLDAGLTTAHGLLGKDGQPLEGCYILDFTGKKHKVRTIKAADDYIAGSATDWALVTFKRIKNPDMVRYAVADPMSAERFDLMAEDRLPVLFSSARGLPQSGQNCSLYPRRYAGLTSDKYRGLLLHDCRAISGQSGAPVSIKRGGKDVLVGMHLGNMFVLQSPYMSRPATHNFMRILDDDLRADIVKAIAAH